MECTDRHCAKCHPEAARELKVPPGEELLQQQENRMRQREQERRAQRVLLSRATKAQPFRRGGFTRGR